MTTNQLADISPEEMAVFIQETEEQLELLDEDLIALEQADDQTTLIQEIFRAAHTLKGSSGMLGLTNMSRVAHAMEAILDKLRNNVLTVSTELINILLNGLDTLKSLKDALVTGETYTVDIAAVITALEDKAKGNDDTAPAASSEALSLSREELEQLEGEAGDRKTVYRVHVTVAPDCAFAAVRLFQVLAELSQTDQVIKTRPTQAELEAGSSDRELDLFLASNETADALKARVDSVPDLENTTAVPYQPEAAAKTPAPDAAKTSPDAVSRTAASKPTVMSPTVRIDIKLLDRLMDLIGEMVIDRNRIGQLSRTLNSRYQGDLTVGSLGETAAHISGIVSDLQENILQARMLPVATVFNSFPRLVRDVAQKAGKKINFTVTGQETELDRNIIEQIRDPLIHLLRNSVDHGIETPEKRIAAGKAETGNIRLSAYQEENSIIISVADDGAGINIGKLKDSVVKKGVISAAEAAILSDHEAIHLIFRAGVSTAAKVTDISGRGVGMDVVKTNIESLGGSIIIQSTEGEGSNFLIKLPLTLATINGLLVSAGSNTYIIPTTAMVEIVRLQENDINSVLGREVMRSRGHTIPLLRLDKMFNLESPSEIDENVTVVVVHAGEQTVGLSVSEVIEPQETVIKPLGDFMGDVRGIAGATILGDGRVALILDTAALIRANINN